MKKIIVIITVILCITACNNNSKGDKPIGNPAEVKKDTLPDTPQFVFTVDDKSYTVATADVDIYYSSSDSTLTINAGKKDGDRLNIVITDIKHTPGYRGNAWRSDNTKLAGSDSLMYQPTATFYKNENGIASWNNLSDGYHEGQPKDDNSIYIYSLRKTGEKNFIIKGRINTKVLKNVYESGYKNFNKDHIVAADFVILFEDYWLKL